MKISITILILMLAGCADYPLHTNLDQKNFQNYFEAADVTLFKTAPDKKYNTVKLLVGFSCQAEPNQPAASETEARTSLRSQAAKIGANGVIIQSCIDQKTDFCLSQVTCTGEAIKVDDAKL